MRQMLLYIEHVNVTNGYTRQLNGQDVISQEKPPSLIESLIGENSDRSVIAHDMDESDLRFRKGNWM
jgi:hypothetical protein